MRRLPVVSATSALVAILLAVPAGVRAADQAPAGSGSLATGSGGAVASMDAGASQAGIDVLKHGGNAVDAAVATASALGVTIPFVAGPGGGGFMVIYLARTHQVVTIDGRENCPAACTPTMFVDPATGQPLGYDDASDQPLATGVPSMVATWAKAVSRYGRGTLASDLAPAIGVAERGFRVNADFVQLTQSDLPELQAYPASRALLLTPSGQPLPVGTLLRNPDLAKTYRLLARYGPSYLYNGPLGKAIVQADDHPVLTPGQQVVRLPGIMTTNDLRAYQARVQAPTRVSYRGLDIYSMAPPSSSGTTVGEALNILSGYNLPAEPRATALFHYLEASRLSYADRNAYVGDPRYVSVPVSGLLNPAFAASRRCLIGHQALTSPVAPGNPHPPYAGCSSQSASAMAPEGGHTNNIVTTDKWGDIVAYTNTINFFGGSGQVVPGYGFLLNNEMTDFDFAPPSAGASDPNLPAGGKQPRSSMGPVIAFRHGTPVFSVGAAGGSTIPTTILQIILNHVDFGLSLPAALAAPRVSQRNADTSLAEPLFYDSALAAQLTSKYGEKFTLATGPILPLDNYPGDATALQILGHGQAEAIAEPVRLGGGSAMVVHPARLSGRPLAPLAPGALAPGAGGARHKVESPVTLGGMANRELVVLGTASQAPTRHRNHNGYFLRWDDEGLLFDPGEGTQRQMLFAGVTASQITRICVTHFHGDHCLGLPGVLARMSLDRVPHPVEVCYPAGSREVFRRLRHASLFRDVLDLRERRIRGAGPVVVDAGAFRLEARALSHSVPTVGYRLAEPDGRRMLPDRLAAAGIAGPDIGRLQRLGRLETGGRMVTVEQVSEPRPGQRFAFIMDTRLCDAAFELAEQADMLVCESTFANAEAALARDYGHLTAGQAGQIAARARVRLLVLTHFSQRYESDSGSGSGPGSGSGSGSGSGPGSGSGSGSGPGSGSGGVDRLAGEAGEAFGGEVVVARDLARIPVPLRRHSTAETPASG